MKKLKDFDEVPIFYKSLADSKTYKRFIRFACGYADCICMTCDGLWYEDFQNSKWGFLSDSILDYEYTIETPVTKGQDVLLLYFKIDHITSRWLRGKRNIYDFMDAVEVGKDYQCLWDLCFAKKGRIVMCSCSHEEFCYIDREMLEAFQGNGGRPGR